MRRIAARDERGAAAIMVAIFLTFVMIPALLITVDVGRVYTERRQLQSGADSAALAVAQDCAKGACAATAGSRANEYADQNANDGGHDVPLQVCGTAGDLPGCGGYSGAELTDCLPLGEDPPKYVQVHTSTDAPAGLLFFGGDETIAACARASLGGARTATGLAFTISMCEWDIMTNGGTNYGDGPEDAMDIELKDGKEDQCLHHPGGGWGDQPGGFGWLDDPDNDCQATVNTDRTYDGRPGNATGGCATVLKSLIDSGETIFIPVFNAVSETGSHIQYQFEGWAAFVMTGYELAGAEPRRYMQQCARVSDFCIRGYFKEDLITDPDVVFGGTDELGASVIGLTG